MAATAKGRRGTNVAAPAGLKLVEGRSEGRDSGGREVRPAPGFVRLPPEPPDYLTGYALEVWERIVPELQRLQLTKPLDSESLAAYCVACQTFQQAQLLIQAEGEHSGLLKVNSQGLVRHPALAVREAASKEMRAWAMQFGLTPAAEGQLAAAGGSDGDDDTFA